MTHDPHHPYALSLQQRVYFVLAAVLVTALILANVVGVKLFRFELSLGPLGTIPVEHTAGMLPFPITFLLTDLLNEYYGKRATRFVAYVAFAMAALGWLIVFVARALPILEGIPGTATHEAFETIFGASALMSLSSIVAFLLGSLLDIHVFGAFKRLTGDRLVWLRTTGSTVVSQLFDSFVITILFFQVMQVATGQPAAPLDFVLRTALTGYVLKFVIAVVLTPFVYAGRALMRDLLGLQPVGGGKLALE
jgi:uncharacterized integral membrane protein (TIGR00697 family)